MRHARGDMARNHSRRCGTSSRGTGALSTPSSKARLRPNCRGQDACRLQRSGGMRRGRHETGASPRRKRRCRLEPLGEADRAQLGCQVLPLPGTLSFLSGLTSSEAHGFRRIGRSVRSVIEHVGYRACLTGCTSSGDGGDCSCFGRVACGRMRCERSGAARRHRTFTAFPSSECRDRCAWSIVTGALLFEDR